jgi:hypothetical protein
MVFLYILETLKYTHSVSRYISLNQKIRGERDEMSMLSRIRLNYHEPKKKKKKLEEHLRVLLLGSIYRSKMNESCVLYKEILQIKQ